MFGSEPQQGESDGSVAANAEDLATLKRRSRMFMWASLGFVLAVIAGAGTFIKTDYIAIIPGPARDTEPLLLIEGIETFPSEGELLFTTINSRENPNVWAYLWYSLDDDIRLVPEDLIKDGKTKKERRVISLRAMTDSKSVAAAVALEQLGYDRFEPDGVLVASVVEDAAADGVLEAGEVIRAIDGVSFLSANELVDYLAGLEPGQQISLSIESVDNEFETRDVVLGAKEGDASAAFLGVSPRTLVAFSETDLGFDLEIEIGDVGGPSAGLAFTLAILDQLTPGELTGGSRIAVTGTMSIDGEVGPVGGVPQKAAAVRDLGIEIFIVPRSLGEPLIEELREVVDGKVEIVPVSDLDDALEVLAGLGGDIEAISEYAEALEVSQ